jgi:hypothetical protein
MRREFLAIGLALSFDWPAPALADEPRDFTYVKGRITAHSQNGDAFEILLEPGKDQGVYAGSTGLVLAGTGEGYLEDVKSQKVRFRVSSADERQARATIFQGDVTPKMLEENRRVVLRAAKKK